MEIKLMDTYYIAMFAEQLTITFEVLVTFWPFDSLLQEICAYTRLIRNALDLKTLLIPSSSIKRVSISVLWKIPQKRDVSIYSLVFFFTRFWWSIYFYPDVDSSMAKQQKSFSIAKLILFGIWPLGQELVQDKLTASLVYIFPPLLLSGYKFIWQLERLQSRAVTRHTDALPAASPGPGAGCYNVDGWWVIPRPIVLTDQAWYDTMLRLAWPENMASNW